MKKRMLLSACLMAGMVFGAPAMAEVAPDPSTIAPDVITLTETTESGHSGNYLILYDIENSTKTYYDITLNTTVYGTGTPTTNYTVKAPYENVNITVNGISDPRLFNPSSVADKLIFGLPDTGTGTAMYNNWNNTVSSITNITFISNNADGGAGGAIYNIGNIITLQADFIGNTATNGNGGAISTSSGTITSLTGNFIGNTATNDGGAISTGSGTITSLTGNFIGNTATNDGGAISTSSGTITSLTGNFIGNTATNGNGGAICNKGSTISIVAKDDDVLFSGNTDSTGSNAIYNASKTTWLPGGYGVPITGFTTTCGIINLNASEGHAVVINDGIDGGDQVIDKNIGDIGYPWDSWSTKGTLNINKNENSMPTSGTVILNNTVKNQEIHFYNGTLQLGAVENMFTNVDMNMHGGLVNSINNNIDTFNFTNLTVVGNTNVAVDVDLASAKMDRFTADNYGSHTGNINVVGMNLLTDAVDPETPTSVLFADNGLKNNVTSDVTEIGNGVSNSYQSTAYAPIYKYDVTYNVKDDGGYFEFARSGGSGPTPGPDSFNPAILATPAAQTANVIATQNIVNNYAFNHVDTCMSHNHGKMSSRYANRYAIADNITTDVNTNNPLFIKPEHESVWFRPFVTFENIPLRNGPNVRSTSYGALVGYDSEPFYYKRGWEGVVTGYVGYTGASIHYKGVDDISNGGLMGATYSLFKGNFFNATTINAGAMLDQVTTMYGKDNLTTLYAGVGNKTGYNFEFKEGLFTLQPSVLLSYTFANTFDYTNAAGVRINSDPLHTIQISPGIKFFMNTKNGWQPYVSVNMMWNIMGHTR